VETFFNTFANTYTKEEVFIPETGSEFGEHTGKCFVIKKEYTDSMRT